MHDDLIDGIQWAINEGVADSEKIAILGASYGGYATLVGLTFTPEIFTCGVDLSGPSNLVTLMKSAPEHWKFSMSIKYRHLGNPNNPEDIKIMEAKSPLFYTDRIVKPLIIVQGEQDVRVTTQEAQQIVDTMRKAGKEVKYILFKNEGHSIRFWNNWLHVISNMESFFAKHLGGRDPVFEY